MTDFDLIEIALLPIALAFAWHAKKGRLTGFDVCVTVAICVVGMMLPDAVDLGLGAILVACIPLLVLAPWALVPLPRSWTGGYDIWSMMMSVSEMNAILPSAAGKAQKDIPGDSDP